MKLFRRISLKFMADEFLRTVKRFPMPVVFSIITAVLLIIQIENYSIFERSPVLVKSIFISILGFFFTLVSTLAIEKNMNRDKIKFIIHLIVFVLLGYLFITLPDKFRDTDYIIFANFLSASLFALMFVYTEKEDQLYFGRYNTILIMRAFTGFVFSGILFIGIASALFAIQELLVGDGFNEKLYGDFWVVISVFFAPVYFLSGIPDDRKDDKDSFSYPAPLKILLQYILIPLVTLYMLILYAYIAKILFTQKWPEGIVSYLIISYSLAGIISIILMSPLDEDESFRWVRTFSRYFFRALIPLVIVLFMAVSKRIGQYGVTERRYFIVVLDLWLGGTALYMIFSKQKKLKLLPVSLSILSLLAIYGPWSCFSVSFKSQRSILQDLLVTNGILSDGTIIQVEKTIPFSDRKSISSIIEYFYDNHGIDKIDFLKPVYQKLAAAGKDDDGEYKYYRDKDLAVSRMRLVKEGFGFDLVSRWQTENSLNYINVALKYIYDPVLEDISGYDRMIDCTDNNINKSVFDEKNRLYLRYEKESIIFSEDTLSEKFSVKLRPHIDDILKTITNPSHGNQLGPEEMTVRNENDSLKYMIAFRNFNMNRADEKSDYKLQSAHFRLYYTVKK